MREVEQKEFRTLLIEKESEIRKSLAHINSEIEGLQQLEINDNADFASVSSDGDTYTIIGSYKVEDLKDIETAINKIDKTPHLFGICERCGDTINRKRLLVKPYALYCKSCREIIEEPLE